MTYFTHSSSDVVFCQFSNPALARFELTNPIRSSSGQIWKIGIWYIATSIIDYHYYNLPSAVMISTSSSLDSSSLSSSDLCIFSSHALQNATKHYCQLSHNEQ